MARSHPKTQRAASVTMAVAVAQTTTPGATSYTFTPSQANRHTGGKEVRLQLVRIVAAAVLYFLWSMVAGFILGTVRELLLVPACGHTAGNLLEAGFMLLAILAGAASLAKWLGVPSTTPARISMGLCSLVPVLAAEMALSPIVHGSFQAWTAQFTPFTFAIAVVLWAAQAAAPALVLLAQPTN